MFRERRIAERKAKELLEKGEVLVYDNLLNTEMLKWTLTREGFLLSPSKKLKIHLAILKRIVLRTQKIQKEVKRQKEMSSVSENTAKF